MVGPGDGHPLVVMEQARRGLRDVDDPSEAHSRDAVDDVPRGGEVEVVLELGEQFHDLRLDRDVR